MSFELSTIIDPALNRSNRASPGLSGFYAEGLPAGLLGMVAVMASTDRAQTRDIGEGRSCM